MVWLAISVVFPAVRIDLFWRTVWLPFRITSYLVVGISCLKFLDTVVKSLWIGACFLLIGIWLWNRAHSPEEAAGWFIFLFFVCLVCFLAEGYELAYTEVRDKDLQEVLPSIRGSVEDVNNKSSLFYDFRELLLIGMIASLTISADFPLIKLPIIGLTYTRAWCLAFSVVFPSAILVWLAQSPGKESASLCLEGFLDFFLSSRHFGNCLYGRRNSLLRVS